MSVYVVGFPSRGGGAWGGGSKGESGRRQESEEDAAVNERGMGFNARLWSERNKVWMMMLGRPRGEM